MISGTKCHIYDYCIYNIVKLSLKLRNQFSKLFLALYKLCDNLMKKVLISRFFNINYFLNIEQKKRSAFTWTLLTIFLEAIFLCNLWITSMFKNFYYSTSGMPYRNSKASQWLYINWYSIYSYKIYMNQLDFKNWIFVII